MKKKMTDIERWHILIRFTGNERKHTGSVAPSTLETVDAVEREILTSTDIEWETLIFRRVGVCTAFRDPKVSMNWSVYAEMVPTSTIPHDGPRLKSRVLIRKAGFMTHKECPKNWALL